MDNMEQLHTFARECAREAGRIQLSYFRGAHLNVETKFNLHDVVTVADKESECYIIGEIAKRYPDHAVLGEESGMHTGHSDYCWVIDPLDGTTNYSQGLPVFTVSIGLQYKGETILGVVYAPYLNELYEGCRGQGATLNGTPIRVSNKNNTQRSVVATGFPIDKDRNPDNNLDNLSRILPVVRGVRRMGSAAYDLCCVAAGFLDGYWEFNLNLWDVCAGMLIVTEAGGVVRSFREDRKVSVLAGSPAIVEALAPRLSDKPGKIVL